MNATLATPLEWRKTLRVWWARSDDHTCEAERVLATVSGTDRMRLRAVPFPPSRQYPRKCAECGRRRQAGEMDHGGASLGTEALWDTESGKLELGCVYWLTCMAVILGKPDCCPWDNCEGRHLKAVCPNGCHWDIDGRASNCTDRDDRIHRCWVRHGDPPGVTVDKQGATCSAGGGSIQCGDYHGFLTGGVFTGA